MVGWGQLVLGPPGSGKSTYCGTLLDLLRSMGRPAIVVNLDPANEDPPYTPGVDVQALISVADAMAAFGLGPNGALLYCMEFLQANQDWLEGALAPHLAAGAYLILDAPGQAELYTSHDALSTVLGRLARALDLRLVALHLVDTLRHAAALSTACGARLRSPSAATAATTPSRQPSWRSSVASANGPSTRPGAATR
jgi:GTPase SAR1 family protein